jgi:uncharacterized damage-inducible protein DinB
MPGPVWLQGPIDGVPALLQPVAHALVEAEQDVRALVSPLSMDAAWSRPNNAASVGFHVRHAIGSLDRLLTYARGEALSDAQLETLKAEKTMDRVATPSELVKEFSQAIDRAVAQLRMTGERDLLSPREVGRARLPSNVIGLLVHAGDHTYRHVGQAITTAKIVAGAQP